MSNHTSESIFPISFNASTVEPFSIFLHRITSTLQDVYSRQGEIEEHSGQRGLPEGVWQKIVSNNPLLVSIPREFGGRGSVPHENLAVLEVASYESLALSLTFGINMGLFLQPVSKYASDVAKQEVFQRFVHQQSLGGLMITEPDHGSDALNMQTWFSEIDGHYHIKGKKHWAGLTGWADYWLLTARRKSLSGELLRDIDFFICNVKKAGQKITVEEIYDNLGLYQIPYGRSRIDVKIPDSHRLRPTTTGVMMMLDLLHRSRLQFPGMGTGFIKRMLDEGLEHCKQRLVAGKSLFSYDQVQERLSKLQSAFTVCSAMSLFSAKKSGLDHDLSQNGLEANTVKTLVTDLMQQSAQSLTQLVGAKAYRVSHIAGRSITDSRPFQIFEGSNDILYAQIAGSVIKDMKRLKEPNMFNYMSRSTVMHLSAKRLMKHFNFRLSMNLPQRKLVELGKVISRAIGMDMVYELSGKGFRQDLTDSALTMLHQEIQQIMSNFKQSRADKVIDDYHSRSSWLELIL